jgi:hypothetical protein
MLRGRRPLSDPNEEEFYRFFAKRIEFERRRAERHTLLVVVLFAALALLAATVLRPDPPPEPPYGFPAPRRAAQSMTFRVLIYPRRAISAYKGGVMNCMNRDCGIPLPNKPSVSFPLAGEKIYSCQKCEAQHRFNGTSLVYLGPPKPEFENRMEPSPPKNPRLLLIFLVPRLGTTNHVLWN